MPKVILAKFMSEKSWSVRFIWISNVPNGFSCGRGKAADLSCSRWENFEPITGYSRKIDTEKFALFYNRGRIRIKKSMAVNYPINLATQRI